MIRAANEGPRRFDNHRRYQGHLLLKAATSTFIFKTLLINYAIKALTHNKRHEIGMLRQRS